MSRTTPTQRTIKLLREQGVQCGVVERWLAHVPRPDGGKGVRQDLFGIIDIIALDPARGVVGIQACGGSGFASHRRTLLGARRSNTELWLRCHGHLDLYAWRKVKVKRGGKAMVWSPKIETITLDTLEHVPEWMT